MKNITAICCHFIWAVLPLLFISACNTKKNIPFPGDGSGSVQPVTRPFTYSESQPLKWKDINPDSIKPPTSIPIDLDKLPSKPFTVNDFKPLKNPIRQIKLDWDNIPDSAINLDTITERPFRLKKSLLPKPVIIKAGMPKLIPNTTSGILQFAEEEGLPGLEVSASLVDKNGMIWLATNNGLCRYTGDYIYSYHFLNKTPIGSDYAITRMTADKTGRIWLATAGDGVYVLDIDNGLVLHDRSKLFGAAIICDHAGNIWLACFNDALYVINPGKGTIKNTAPGTERKQENLVYSVIEDRYHNIWTGNPDRIGIIDSSRKKMKRLTKNEGLNISFAVEFFEDSRGDMWIGNLTRGLNFISLKNKTLSKIDTYNGFKGGAVKYTEDREGQIWIARRDTFYILNKQRTAIKNIVTNVRMIDQFYIGTSLTDQQGNIWVGSVDKGMIIIDPQGPLPEHLDTKNGLIDNNVWGILEDKDKKIWIGTYNGINIYDPQKDQLRVLGTDQGLGNNRIRRIMEFDGNEILATTQTGFSIINRDKKSLTNYGREQGLAGYYLTKALKDDSNRVWLNGFQGILIYDMAKNTQQLLDRSTGLLSNLVWDMVADRHGNIWAGSDSGICVINPVTNTIKYLRESEGLCNNIVQKMVVRDNGEIWIATQKGISVVNADKNTITNLTVSEGLVPEIIFDLLEQNNKMYAGSVDGLIVITQPDTSGNTGKKNTKWSFINYGKRQGFPFNDYNQNTGTATTNGQTWWGVTPVLTVVTQPVATDSIAPRVYITGINIMDESPPLFITISIKRTIKYRRYLMV
ncbi:MAG: two-component regulator propeller domain-containing protein [Bacteroidota bacterium]